MTLTFRPIDKPKRLIKADTRALQSARADTHRRLQCEIEEQRISAELVSKHNRKARNSRIFQLTGEI